MEFGAGSGILSYSGDLVRGYNFSSPKLGGTAFYRMNLSEIVSVKLALTVGGLKGSETPIDAFAIQRNHGFTNSTLELSSVFEYHFLDFKGEKSLVDWSPYAFAGFAVLRVGKLPQGSNTGKFQPVFPMGIGVKHLIGKRFSLGFETGARKTFFDELDGVSDGDQTIKDFQYGNPKDNDWYFFTCISLSIILYNIPCPFPYVPNKSVLSR